MKRRICLAVLVLALCFGMSGSAWAATAEEVKQKIDAIGLEATVSGDTITVNNTSAKNPLVIETKPYRTFSSARSDSDHPLIDLGNIKDLTIDWKANLIVKGDIEDIDIIVFENGSFNMMAGSIDIQTTGDANAMEAKGYSVVTLNGGVIKGEGVLHCGIGADWGGKPKVVVNDGKISFPNNLAITTHNLQVNNPAGITGLVAIEPKDNEKVMEVYGATNSAFVFPIYAYPSVVKCEVKKGATWTVSSDALSVLNENYSLLVEEGGKMIIKKGDKSIDLNGTLTNSGDVTNESVINNYSGKTIDNRGKWTNRGTINNKSMGMIKNTGTLNNISGAAIVNEGTIDNANGAKIANEGTFNNDKGTINNQGEIRSVNEISGDVLGNPVQLTSVPINEPDDPVTVIKTIQAYGLKAEISSMDNATIIVTGEVSKAPFNSLDLHITGLTIDWRANLNGDLTGSASGNNPDKLVVVTGPGTLKITSGTTTLPPPTKGVNQEISAFEGAEGANIEFSGGTIKAEGSGHRRHYGIVSDKLTVSGGTIDIPYGDAVMVVWDKGETPAALTVEKDSSGKPIAAINGLVSEIENVIPEKEVADHLEANIKSWIYGKFSISGSQLYMANAEAIILNLDMTIANGAVLTIEETGSLTIPGNGIKTGTVTNNGTISIYGKMTNKDKIINNVTINNYSGKTLDNQGTLTNNGKLYNDAKGKITNTGRINNSKGTIDNRGQFESVQTEVQMGGKFENGPDNKQVQQIGSSEPPSGGGSGCSAGFGVFGLAAAAFLFLRRK